MVTNNKLIDPSVISNLNIFNFHRVCKAMATDFVSQNSSSGSHWLMLRMEASTFPHPGQNKKSWGTCTQFREQRNDSMPYSRSPSLK